MTTINYKNKTIKIIPDENSESPREWDNLGTMICFHRKYSLGDKNKLSIEEVKKIEKNSNDYISLPLYLYDHSGITMNTTGFSCPWDSGKIGVIFVSKEKIRNEYGWKVITQKRKEKILSYLKSEVSTYDQYLTGDVYSYEVIDEDETIIDSCCGCFGEEYTIDRAKSFIDSLE